MNRRKQRDWKKWLPLSWWACKVNSTIFLSSRSSKKQKQFFCCHNFETWPFWEKLLYQLAFVDWIEFFVASNEYRLKLRDDKMIEIGLVQKHSYDHYETFE